MARGRESSRPGQGDEEEAAVLLGAKRAWNSILTGPASAISLSNSLAVAIDSTVRTTLLTRALERPAKSALRVEGVTSRAIFWSPWKRLSRDQNVRFRCNAWIGVPGKP